MRPGTKSDVVRGTSTSSPASRGASEVGAKRVVLMPVTRAGGQSRRSGGGEEAPAGQERGLRLAARQLGRQQGVEAASQRRCHAAQRAGQQRGARGGGGAAVGHGRTAARSAGSRRKGAPPTPPLTPGRFSRGADSLTVGSGLEAGHRLAGGPEALLRALEGAVGLLQASQLLRRHADGNAHVPERNILKTKRRVGTSEVPLAGRSARAPRRGCLSALPVSGRARPMAVPRRGGGARALSRWNREPLHRGEGARPGCTKAGAAGLACRLGGSPHLLDLLHQGLQLLHAQRADVNLSWVATLSLRRGSAGCHGPQGRSVRGRTADEF